jgi:PKD repeat protein
VLADFGYDGDGMRVTKASGGKTVVYHYDQAGGVLSENCSDGRFIADYVFLNGKLLAKVAAAPTISVAPASDSFGNVYINTTSSAHTFTVRNTGSADLVIGAISITGSNLTEFVKSADVCAGQTLAPSASCTVNVSFAPVSNGAKAVNLSIASNDPAAPTFNVSLNGVGSLPVLTVSKGGPGSGTVTSSPAGISCGSTCSTSFFTGTGVTLTAAPVANSSFAGWSGGGCSGTGNCSVTMNANANVTATFNLLPPVANFSATPTTGGAPNIVNFTSSSQYASTWLWNFGDGATSTVQNPSHIYNVPGTYTVSLTVTNASGTNTATKSNYIAMTQCQNSPVRISGKSSYSTLQAAYNAAVSGDVIQSQVREFAENLNANRDISVTFVGGYLCNYSSNPDKSILKGAPAINSGTITMKDFFVTN